MRTAKERLEDNDIEDGVVYFDEPAFVESIIGTTFEEETRVVYDYNVMVEEYAKYHDITREDAADYINYNCIRSASYLGSKAPIIMYPLLL